MWWFSFNFRFLEVDFNVFIKHNWDRIEELDLKVDFLESMFVRWIKDEQNRRRWFPVGWLCWTYLILIWVSNWIGVDFDFGVDGWHLKNRCSKISLLAIDFGSVFNVFEGFWDMFEAYQGIKHKKDFLGW